MTESDIYTDKEIKEIQEKHLRQELLDFIKTIKIVVWFICLISLLSLFISLLYSLIKFNVIL